MFRRGTTQVAVPKPSLSHTYFNAYRIMWVLVFFDLPTDTAGERKAAARFRKDLLADGFTMFQFSIYMRHCSSRDNMEVHQKRVIACLPEKGHVGMLTITDAQFGRMQIWYNAEEKEEKEVPQQLELF
jgi:CRISPR-associated protein Cas2